MPRLESIRIPQGAASGRVLTSDVNGNGTWQPAGGVAAAGQQAFRMGGWGPAVSVGVAAWKTLIPYQSSPTIEPSGAFTLAADHVVINQPGWYQISVTAGGPASANYALAVSIGGTPDAEGFWALGASDPGATTANAWPSTSTAGSFAAGQKIYITVYSTLAGNCHLRYLSIASLGGPTGAKGDKGDPGSGGGGAQIPTTYSITAGYTKDRAMDPTAMTLNEVATVLATLVDDMKVAGMIAP